MTMSSRPQVAEAASSERITRHDASNVSSGNSGAEKEDSGNSGYSADGSVAIVPPVFIDFLEVNDSNNQKNSQNRGNKTSKRAERRKAVELSFAASLVRADLEKGGMTLPEIEPSRMRNLAGCEVDLSKVELRKAKTVKNSPFLFTREKPVEYPEIQSVFDSLFVATYHSYEKNDGLHWDSSTSSVTSSESDGSGMPPPALVIPPLLEDAIKAKEEHKANVDERKTVNAGSKRKRGGIDSLLPKLEHTTMNDALEASSEARYVNPAESIQISAF